MTCKIIEDENGNFIAYHCGPEPKPKDHECDVKGPFVEIMGGMGGSATCSVCGRLAYQEWEMW